MQNFDYIVVGAGTAGSPLAARLSEHSNNTVALLEAGGENTNDLSRIPGAFARVWGTDYDWQYRSTPQKELVGRVISHPRGRVMGGSSAINGGMWLRGSREDYDFPGEAGKAAWTFEDALRIFHIIEDTGRGPNAWRGKGGVMHMEDTPSPTPLTDALEQGFVQAGFGPQADTNGENPCSVARLETTFRNHTRITTADAYLDENVRKRKNLDIFTNATVLRVIFDKNKAVGVEVEQDGKSLTIMCNKEIILCAGSFNTPKILLLSGVGPREELEKHGIDVVADLPGVGSNLSDHLMSSFSVLSPVGVNASVPMDSSDAAVEEWRRTRSGPAIYWSANTIGFLSMDGKKHGPDFELMMDYNPGFNTSDPTVKEQGDISSRSGYTFMIILLQPESRGTVRLASANPKDAPVIDPGYFSHPGDMKRFVEAFRKVAAMPATKALRQYTEIVSPALDASDAEIEEHIRKTASTVYHPTGTARIGDAHDPMSVVDSALRVRKVTGLRVADVSIFPKVNRGHTMVPGIVIGEKCAESIIAG